MLTCWRPLLPLPFPDPPPGPEATAAVAGTIATAPVSIAPTSIRRNRILRPFLRCAPYLGDAPTTRDGRDRSLCSDAEASRHHFTERGQGKKLEIRDSSVRTEHIDAPNHGAQRPCT